MPHTQNTFAAKNMASVNTLKRLSMHLFSSVEKLAELNLATSKALLAGSFQHTRRLLDAQQPQDLLDLQMGLIVPLSEKTTSYSQHVFSLVTGMGAELNQALESRISEIQKSMADAVTSVMPNAPETLKGPAVAIQ